MVTIAASTRRTVYNPVVATTHFEVGFPIFDNADIVLLHDGEEIEFDIAATYVDGVSVDAECIVTPGITGKVEVVGRRAPRRTDQYQNGAPLAIRDHNYSLNRLTIESQEARRDADRAFKAPYGTAGGEIVQGTDGNLAKFTADGLGDAGVGGAALTAVASIADEVEAVAGNAANINAVAANEADIDTAATNIAAIQAAPGAASAAADSAAEAAGYAAGLNLPPIEAGDAGKTLVVKGDETGYEHIAPADVADGAPIVILATGQSNMNVSRTFDWSPSPRIHFWRVTADGVIPSGFSPAPDTSVFFSTAFADRIADLYPGRDIYLVNVAFGGQPIAQWLPGASAPDVYDNIVENMPLALAAAGVDKIDLLLWWQGESDVNAPTNYRSDFNDVMARFKGEDWFPPETPVVVMGTANSVVAGNVKYNVLNTLLQACVADDPNRMFVYSATFTGATFWADTLHPTAAGYYAMGRMAAQQFAEHGGGNARGAYYEPVIKGVAIGVPGYSNAKLTVSANLSKFNHDRGEAYLAHFVGEDGGADKVQIDGFATGPSLGLARANGTAESPSAVTSVQVIGSYFFGGFRGTTWIRNAAEIRAFSLNNWSETDNSTGMLFLTTLPGQTSPSGVVLLNQNGLVTQRGGIRGGDPLFGIGYATGAGGTVTQATNKSTGVTLDKSTGQITMNGAALAANTAVSFTLTNGAIEANDLLVLNHRSGGTAGAYALNAQCAAGSAVITVRNLTAGSLSEAIVIGYALIKGVTA